MVFQLLKAVTLNDL